MMKKLVSLYFPAQVIKVPERWLKVESCGQCPYCNSHMGQGEPAQCIHPKAPKGYDGATGIWCEPPKWCPGRY